MESNHFIKTMIVTSFIFTIVLVNANLLAKATAETGVGKDVFKVIVTLFGITNSTKDITTIVNVKDQTKVKVFNAENPESEVEDKVSYTMTFPNLTVDDGDPYSVCTVSVEDFELNCVEGNNSPLNRPEFVDIDVSGGGSSEGDQEEGSNEED
ncbi:MAG TPA: hypothetical protein VFX26_00350 [Nitrososphaeraceae archaeon]|jgi:hypothetical protein|nr:hypothetical protein [Nitrososphaeraceae archaeon]